MKIFTIAKGTQGFLLTEQAGVDIEQKEWETRRKLDFNREDVLVDPIIFKNNRDVYPADSLAAELANKGYIIFNNRSNDSIQKMLAVQYSDVIVS